MKQVRTRKSENWKLETFELWKLKNVYSKIEMEKEFLGNLANGQEDTAQKTTSKKSIAKKATVKKTIGEKTVTKIAKPDQRLQESTKIDIIASLLCNYGIIGQNLAREILSFMDFR